MCTNSSNIKRFLAPISGNFSLDYSEDYSEASFILVHREFLKYVNLPGFDEWKKRVNENVKKIHDWLDNSINYDTLKKKPKADRRRQIFYLTVNEMANILREFIPSHSITNGWYKYSTSELNYHLIITTPTHLKRGYQTPSDPTISVDVKEIIYIFVNCASNEIDCVTHENNSEDDYRNHNLQKLDLMFDLERHMINICSPVLQHKSMFCVRPHHLVLESLNQKKLRIKHRNKKIEKKIDCCSSLGVYQCLLGNDAAPNKTGGKAILIGKVNFRKIVQPQKKKKKPNKNVETVESDEESSSKIESDDSYEHETQRDETETIQNNFSNTSTIDMNEQINNCEKHLENALTCIKIVKNNKTPNIVTSTPSSDESEISYFVADDVESDQNSEFDVQVGDT
jgi:hypothetical protein